MHQGIIRLLVVVLIITTVILAALPITAQPASRHLTPGNPSGAATDVNTPANYLVVRDQYALAYNRDQGIPLWVSWNLAQTDLGTVERFSGNFITDNSLPAGWPRITHDDYTGTGYDRGHMTPSADRTATEADNQATFLMTNILPQAPNNNRGPWAQLEDAARDLVGQGNEIYIVAGPDGSRGTIAGGRVLVPAATWKAMLVLPQGDDDLNRITASNRVIAVRLPNDNTLVAQGDPWQSFCTTIDALETNTGYDLFAALPDTVEVSLEAKTVETGAAHVRATGGISQSVTVNSAPAAPLQVTVCDTSGLPVRGVSVTFTAPTSGTGGSFPNSTRQVVVQSGADGVATAPLFTANATTGSYSIEATIAGSSTPARFTLTNQVGDQPAPSPQTAYLPLIFRSGTAPATTPTATATATATSTATATATVGPSPTPTLPPPSFVNCATPPTTTTAPDYPLQIVTIDKVGETVTLRNTTTGDTIDLTGWRMCSITGGQQHPLSGSLAPGEQRIFPNQGSAIWSNTGSDPGALYDPQGRLISYRAN